MEIQEEIKQETPETTVETPKKRGRPKGSTNKPKNPPIKTEESGRIEKKLTINLDYTPQRVVSLDKEGYKLFFDSTPGKFLRLSDHQLDLLGRDNRDRYLVSEGLYAREKYQKDHPDEVGSGIEVSGVFATATERLKVEGKEPGKWYAWKRPDELRKVSREGYQIARGKSLRTFMGQGDEIHRVGEYGKDELILTEIPEEQHQKRRRIVGEKSRKRIEAVETNAVEEMRRGGGVPYVPPEKDGHHSWS